jgi:hypothetical protein
MIGFIFGIARIVAGVIGALWLVGGLVGAAEAGLDHAWASALTAALGALFGFCLAYGAFVRFPWESGRSRQPAP